MIGNIILCLLIGIILFFYITRLTFRHFINIVLIFIFKIPVRILEFIDRQTCYVPAEKPNRKGRHYIEPPMEEVYEIEEPEEENMTPDKVVRTKEPKQSVRGKDFKEYRTLDGKMGSQINEDTLTSILKNNPEIKVERNN